MRRTKRGTTVATTAVVGRAPAARLPAGRWQPAATRLRNNGSCSEKSEPCADAASCKEAGAAGRAKSSSNLDCFGMSDLAGWQVAGCCTRVGSYRKRGATNGAKGTKQDRNWRPPARAVQGTGGRSAYCYSMLREQRRACHRCVAVAAQLSIDGRAMRGPRRRDLSL